jgi:hypothetical protein
MTNASDVDLYRGGPADAAPELQVLRLASGHLAAQAVHVFAALGLAEHLKDGAKSDVELAALTGTRGDGLYRVLRFLGTLGVVAEHEGRRFELGALGRTLRHGAAAVIRDNVLLTVSSAYWTSIGRLLHALKTGENAFESAHGMGYFEFVEAHAEDAAVFNAAMNSSSRLGVSAILAAYDFSDFATVVDVAGGQGGLLQGILRKHLATRGILFDAASVVAGASVDPQIAGRFTATAGSFFDGVPQGGDAYILRRILHDWNDEKALEILRAVRGSIGERAKLLIIEAAAPAEGESGNNWAALDLLMMLMMDGRERTAEELKALLARAGFVLERVVRTRSPMWVLEARPVGRPSKTFVGGSSAAAS